MSLFRNCRTGSVVVLTAIVAACGSGGGGDGGPAPMAWETPRQLSLAGHDVNGEPGIATDAAGNALVIWRETENNKDQVWSSRYTQAAGWEAAQRLDAGASDTIYSAWVVMDAAGNAWTAWAGTDVGGGYTQWRRRHVPGIGWQTALDTPNAGADMFPLAMDSAGNTLFAWMAEENNTYIVKAQYYNAATDTMGAVASRATGISSRPYSLQAGMSDDGRAVLAWLQEAAVAPGAQVESHAWRSFYWQDGNVLGPIGRLNAGNSRAGMPVVKVTRHGDAMVAWQQGAPGQDGSRVSYEHYSNSGSGWGIASGELDTAPGFAAPVGIISGSQDRLQLAWGYTPATDIMAPAGGDDWSIWLGNCNAAGCSSGKYRLLSHPMYSVGMAMPASPILATDAGGNTAVLWNQPRKQQDGNFMYTVQTSRQPAGKGWSRPVAMNGNALYGSSLAFSQGKVVAAGMQSDDGNSRSIWASHSR